MSQAWNKILLSVALVHAAVLSLVWVGLASPQPLVQASFAYVPQTIEMEGQRDQYYEPVVSQEALMPKQQLKQDEKILQQLLLKPTKERHNVRLGL